MWFEIARQGIANPAAPRAKAGLNVSVFYFCH